MIISMKKFFAICDLRLSNLWIRSGELITVRPIKAQQSVEKLHSKNKWSTVSSQFSLHKMQLWDGRNICFLLSKFLVLTCPVQGARKIPCALAGKKISKSSWRLGLPHCFPLNDYRPVWMWKKYFPKYKTRYLNCCWDHDSVGFAKALEIGQKLGLKGVNWRGQKECNIPDFFYESQKYELFKIFPVIVWSI